MRFSETDIKLVAGDTLHLLSRQPTSVGDIHDYYNGFNQNTLEQDIEFINQVIGYLKSEGHNIYNRVNKEGVKEYYHIPYDTSNPENENSVIFGLISDTHWGSTRFRQDYLEQYYQIIKERGIKTVFHCGDLIAGRYVFEEQEIDNQIKTVQKQCTDFAKNYPSVTGVETVGISGNHDIGEFYLNGISNKSHKSRYKHFDAGEFIIKEALKNGRDDLIYLGQCNANVVFDKFGNIIHLTHLVKTPNYKQKHHASPNGATIIAEGHRHITDSRLSSKKRNNRYTFGCGTFSDSSSLFKENDMVTPISGLTIEVKYEDDRISSIVQEMISFE